MLETSAAAPISEVADRVQPTVGQLQADGEHACILHTGAQDLDVLAVYAALMGPEFEVLGPPELAERAGVLAA